MATNEQFTNIMFTVFNNIVNQELHINETKLVIINVFYGSSNFFTFECPENYKLGDLQLRICQFLKITSDELLYVIFNGKQLIKDDLDKPIEKKLDSIQENKCSMHLILKSHNPNYIDKDIFDLRYNHDFKNWKLLENNVTISRNLPQTNTNTLNVLNGLGNEMEGEIGVRIAELPIFTQDVPRTISPSRIDDIIISLDVMNLHNDDSIDISGSCFCGENLDNGEELAMTRSCRHIFHKTCITRWLTNHNYICPTCNYDLST